MTEEHLVELILEHFAAGDSAGLAELSISYPEEMWNDAYDEATRRLSQPAAEPVSLIG